MATAPIMRDIAMAWLTREERNTATGIISAGKTVLVISPACSTMLVEERSTVSLNNSHGSMAANSHRG